MRRAGITLVLLALLLGLGAAATRFVVPGLAFRYPDGPLDTTMQARGELALSIDPATATSLPQPQVLPLTVTRRLRVVDGTGRRAIVREDDTRTIGQLRPQRFVEQYELDRRTLRNLPGDSAYAYQPDNLVNRSPTYTVNLPFAAGAGPYPIWEDEAGRTMEVRRTGTTSVDGVHLARYTGTLTGAPVQPAYVAALAEQGIPSELTAEQAAVQLRTPVADPVQLRGLVLPRLTGTDRSRVSGLLAAPVPLHYTLHAATSLLVDPRTGTVVSLERVEQALGAAPDPARFRSIQTVLAQPQYANDPVLRLAGVAFGMVGRPRPTAPVLRMTYSQTPASVSALARFADSRGTKVDLVRRTVPLALLTTGLLVLILGVVFVATGPKPPRGRHAR